jgi:hypothetical protein
MLWAVALDVLFAAFKMQKVKPVFMVLTIIVGSTV